jgi:hypothetical protein
MEERISVSCAALARIMIDGKYVLLMNKGKYGPIGGALKYYDNTIPTLERFDYRPERSGEDLYDLRINIPRKNWSNFKKWFSMFTWRETSVYREVMEELQPYLETDISDMKDTFLFVREVVDSFKHRMFQIHAVELSPTAFEELRSAILNHSDLVLVSKEQILSGEMNISNHAKHILIDD